VRSYSSAISFFAGTLLVLVGVSSSNQKLRHLEPVALCGSFRKRFVVSTVSLREWALRVVNRPRIAAQSREAGRNLCSSWLGALSIEQMDCAV